MTSAEPRLVARSLAAALDRIALAGVLVLVCLRAFLPESTSFETPSWTRMFDVPAGPLPATTLTFDAIIAACGFMVLIARLLRGERIHAFSLTGLALTIVALTGLLATLRAGQKTLAVIGLVDFVATLALLPILRALLTHAARIRLVTAALLATGSVFALRCYYQVLVDFPTTREFYQQHRNEWVAGAGDEGAGKLYDFEQRLKSAEATGYFVHPNVAASYLVLVAMTALAVLSDRWRRRSAPAGRMALILPGLIVAASFGALWLCQSDGARVALFVGLAVWAIGHSCGRRFSARPRCTLAAFWLGFVLPVACVAGYGLARGGLPSRSMLFRWQYWRGAAAMIRDHAIVGVGFDNFGRHFARYKPLECPEDVQDPHSWAVRLAAEIGLPGLVGMLLFLFAASRRIARSTSTNPPEFVAQNGVISIRSWTVALGLPLFLGWAAVYSDATSSFLLITLAIPALVWPSIFFLGALEPATPARFSNEPFRAMRPALVGGAVAFMLHGLIDMGFFVPGALTAFVVVLALAGSTAEPVTAEASTPRPRLAALAGAVGVATLATFSVWLIAPAAECGHWLNIARRASPPAIWEDFIASPTYAAYARAERTLPMDATAAEELLSHLLGRLGRLAHCDEVARWIDVLRTRDRDNALADRAAATLYRIRFELTRDAADLRHSIAAMRAWIAADPTWPPARLTLARFLATLQTVDPSADTCAEARREFQTALDQDRARVYVSGPNRFSTEQRAAIEAEMRKLNCAQPTRSAATRSS